MNNKDLPCTKYFRSVFKGAPSTILSIKASFYRRYSGQLIRSRIENLFCQKYFEVEMKFTLQIF